MQESIYHQIENEWYFKIRICRICSQRHSGEQELCTKPDRDFFGFSLMNFYNSYQILSGSTFQQWVWFSEILCSPHQCQEEETSIQETLVNPYSDLKARSTETYFVKKMLPILSKYSPNTQQEIFILIGHADEGFTVSHLQSKMPLIAGTRQQRISLSAGWAKLELEEEDGFFSESSLYLMKQLNCPKVKEILEIKIPSCQLGSSQGFWSMGDWRSSEDSRRCCH